MVKKISITAFLAVSLVLFFNNNLLSKDLTTLTEKKLIEILESFGDKYNVFFSYEKSIVEDVKVEFEFVKDEKLNAALDRLFKSLNLSYDVFGDKYIVIYKVSEAGNKDVTKIKHYFKEIEKIESKGRVQILRRSKSNAISIPKELAAIEVIKGTIKDENGVPLIGASILVVGNSTGTTTDIDGNFTLDVSSFPITLKISYTGYDPKTIIVENAKDALDIILTEGLDLEEVVVVGYGSVKKSDVTGAVGSVDVEQMQKLSSIDVRQNLQGAVAGIQVTSNSAAPGSGSTSIRIRGVGSFANSDPLFVVDGFITNDLSNIAPTDIESIEVLKDASATAIYGSRGANGVVLVTTKRAKKGSLSIELNSYFGVQDIINRYDVLNTKEYAQAYLISRYGEGATIEDMTGTSQSQITTRSWIAGALDGSIRGTDWQDEVTQIAPISNTNLSISGGKEKIAYKFGGTYFSQKGTLINTYADRIQLNGAVAINPIKRLSIDASLRYSNNEYLEYNQGIYTSIMATAVRKDPLASPKLPAEPTFFNDSRITDLTNPSLAAFQQESDVTKENRWNANAKITFDILENLKFNTVISYDRKKVSQIQNNPEYYSVNQFNPVNLAGEFIFLANATNTEPLIFEDRRAFTIFQNSSYFNFSEEKGKHSFGVDLGTEYFRSEFEDTPGRETITPQSNAYTLLSFFARGSYNYDNRYLATVTWRRDGSSKFDEDYRWGDFPSFALAWNLFNESFFPKNTLVSRFKLRAGWGQIGNSEPIAPYQYLALLSQGNVYSFDNQNPFAGIAAEKLPASTLRWETSEMVNAGVDLSFLDGKVTVTADYFVKNTKDLLVPEIPVPNFVGALGPSSNAASMENRGLELSLGYRTSIGELKMNISGNISFIDNKVTNLGALDQDNSFIPGGENEKKIELPATRIIKGDEFASFYGYQILGVFQTDEEANAYRAVNADGLPTDNQGNVLTDVDPNTFIGTRADGTTAVQAQIQRNTKAGDYKYQDTNFDGKINEQDAVRLGSAVPDFTYGGNISLNYKAFDFSFTISGSHGNEAANIFKYYAEGTTATLNNITRDRFYNRWTPENGSNTVAILSSGANANNDNFSSRYVEDASYMRIRNIQLGYTFKNELLEKWKLTRLRAYASVDNVATFTSYSGLDPEVGARDSFSPGVDYFSYPLARTIFLGLNVTF